MPMGSGARLEFTKPPLSTTIAPAAASERAATTSFDVDIYEPKAGDTWEAISREFYNDPRYAAGLRAYNRNKPLQGSGPVDVPPIHIVKRAMPAGTAPANSGNNGGSAGQPSKGASSQDWNAVTTSTTRTGNVTKFTVPQGGGMTMRGIARTMLGNEQRWKDIYDLNPELKPDDPLPAGTEVKLPPDARNPR
jgi:nucleoid-associated protein YgaU